MLTFFVLKCLFVYVVSLSIIFLTTKHFIYSLSINHSLVTINELILFRNFNGSFLMILRLLLLLYCSRDVLVCQDSGCICLFGRYFDLAKPFIQCCDFLPQFVSLDQSKAITHCLCIVGCAFHMCHDIFGSVNSNRFSTTQHTDDQFILLLFAD